MKCWCVSLLMAQATILEDGEPLTLALNDLMVVHYHSY
jgi:hypothetical protein